MGKALLKGALEECGCCTCCRKEEWARNCDFCNRMGECWLIFCTKGHCNRHMIVYSQEMEKEKEGDERDEKHQEEATETATDEPRVDVATGVHVNACGVDGALT